MQDPNYPAMKWHPETGEAKTFVAPEDVPEGWLDIHPSNLPEPAPVAASKVVSPADSAALPMTREEMKAELSAGGIPFASNAKDATLYAALKKGVQEFLTGAGVAFPADADVPALIALAKTPPNPLE